MISAAEPISTETLRQRWETLRVAEPTVSLVEAAAALDVSEWVLASSALGSRATRLRPAWRALLPALGELGEVVAETRNSGAWLQVTGTVGRPEIFTVPGDGLLGHVLGRINLRMILTRWAYAVALVGMDDSRQLHFFNRQGRAVHAIHVAPDGNVAAFDQLTTRFAHDDQTPALWDAEAAGIAGPEVVPDDQVDRAAFADAWQGLLDPHQFHVLLHRFNIGPRQALRLAPDGAVTALSADDFYGALTRLVADDAAHVTARVGHRDLNHRFDGLLRNMRSAQGLTTIDAEAMRLTLVDHSTTQFFLVHRPSIGHTLEVFNADACVLTLDAHRSPGDPEPATWLPLVQPRDM